MIVCTLYRYTDYLLSPTDPTTSTGLSRLLDGALSHDHVTRWLSQGTYGPAEVWRQAKPPAGRQAEARRPAGGLACRAHCGRFGAGKGAHRRQRPDLHLLGP